MSRTSANARNRAAVCDRDGSAGSAGGERKRESGSVAVGAGRGVVDVDAVMTNPEGARYSPDQVSSTPMPCPSTVLFRCILTLITAVAGW
jgi:hypothetical protein